MAHRNFSMIEYLNRRAEDWTPKLSFRGSTQEDWLAWREKSEVRSQKSERVLC